MHTDSDIRSILDEIFLHPTISPWEEFPPHLLIDLRINRTTKLYWREQPRLIAQIIPRRESPNPERYVGSFAISKSMIERLSLYESEGKVDMAFVANVEDHETATNVISFVRAATLAVKVLAKISPWESPRSDEPFYWLDDKLNPRPHKVSRRRFRGLRKIPDSLKDDEEY